ncbi:hypothetical protein BCR36DRAFT_580711 [Piromyces finnis]|uniref:BRCT domain-containing protein n=1 Tax=Piromyces finnis TaxID=1754191 RepID=A0A1Y1VJU5_9FUNG|nr:hypothetical protein BCR36DRAFT_580711 [Piromyces finnis]|eukprot:ORX57301.1 hypothetical protein BCR36DRAFT_580711 [Piromyces finnis]
MKDSNNLNNPCHIKRISVFGNNNCNNNSNKNNKSNNKEITNNTMLSNRILKDKEKIEKAQQHPQHIYIQEDRSVKIKNENQQPFVDNMKNINDSISSSNSFTNNNDKALNKALVHKESDSKLNHIKGSDSKTINLKKCSFKHNPVFSHSFHLSQAPIEENVDVERMNFNFSSVIYDNPSTGAMKSCIGYVDPNYIKKEKNNKELKLKGLKPYMDNRESKIGQQSTEDQVSDIFKGVVVYINGFSRNCTDVELKRLIRIHGGKVCWYMSETKVTHVICSSLCESKIQKYINSKTNHYKLVNDKWIIESIKANKRLSEIPYLVLNSLKKMQNQRNLFDYIKK